MKKSIVLMIIVICALTGCTQFNTRDITDEEDCMLSFHLVGEIISSESPITKSSSNDIYMLQVYSGTSAFASGFFDDVQKIRINLKKGSTYRIIVALLKNGKQTLLSLTNNGYALFREDINGVNCEYYGAFTWHNASTGGRYYLPLNNCYYNAVGNYYYYVDDNTPITAYDNANKFVAIDKGMIKSAKYPQCDDWFYGEINGYSPTGEFETLDLDLKRVGFKLKYELSGVTDGEVTVKVYNGTKTFINNTTSTSSYSSTSLFYAFYEARNAWLYADDYMENFTLAVSWLRGIGITEDYGTKTIQLKRNCLNNIKINLGSNDQSAGMNLTVEAESTIGAETVTIPVE